MQFSLGQPAPDPLSMLWQITLSALYGALMAPIIFRIARWAMMPNLGPGSDPMQRRRKATMTSQSVLAKPTIDTRRRRKLSRRRSSF